MNNGYTPNGADKAYNDLCRDILKNGTPKKDRTGTGTLSVFGRQIRFDLSEGFPLLTGKKMPFRIIAEELLFFLRGSTNLKELLDERVDIWTRDGYAKFKRDKGVDTPMTDEGLRQFRALAKLDGFDLGPIYGAQWRSWGASNPASYGGYDQLAAAIEELKSNPDSRRMIVMAWNPDDLDEMALPPCHVMFQFYVADGKLSLQMYQRSADVFLGLPFNIASYALLTEMVAAVCDLDVGELIISLGDAHIYTNHIPQVEEQIKREPMPLAKLFLTVMGGIDDFEWRHIDLIGYQSHPKLRGEQSF